MVFYPFAKKKAIESPPWQQFYPYGFLVPGNIPVDKDAAAV